MANELKHGSVGTELTQAEWEGIGTHVLESQAAGDIVYASSSSQLRRLAKGTDTHVLILSSGVPAWSATTGITTVGTIATGVWQGTDVGVAYGGTGVSTLTANGVLIGNGASAITSVVMTTKGHILIGDGSGNPQMLGVGTNTHVMTADSGETTGVKWAAPAAAAAGSLTGSTLASGVTASSLTSVGTIATGVWQGTDVGVAYGGTGVSTLTSNAVLTGNGASAITAEANLTFDGSTLTVTADVIIAGTTPTLTIGDAGTEDAALVFDGNAQDYYIGLDDTADSLVIGKGSVLGTTAMMSIGSGPTLGINRTATSSSVVAIGGAITGADGYDASALSITTTVTPHAGDFGYIVRLAGTIAEAGSGTHPNVAQLYLGGTAVTAGGGATTNASALYIDAAMSGATNNYSIFVDAGSVRLDGSLWVEGTPTEGSSGEQLTSGGAGAVMTWAAASSLGKFKNTIADLVPQDALTKLMSWRPRSFRYKPDAETSTHDYETIYVGVYGEDAPEVMHHEGRIFSPVSAFGYTVGAIQELHNKIQKLEIQLAAR